jgi:ABC-type transport system involved in multi-copper enzyme maturation permease subunit
MIGGAVWGIFFQTYKATIRSKWLILFAIVFFLFSFNLPFLSTTLLSAVPVGDVTNFIQVVITSAFTLLPILGLTVGAVSIVEERESGSLSYILATPTSRGKFLIARTLGLFAATSSIIILGFTLASLLAFRLSAGSLQIWYITVAACLLNGTMICISMVISTVSKKRLTAYGAAIFIWFLFAYAGDTTLIGPVLATANRYSILIPWILLNPIEVSRLIAIFSLLPGIIQAGPIAVQNTDLGSTGEAIIYIFGNASILILWLTIALWAFISFFAAFFILTFQDIK